MHFWCLIYVFLGWYIEKVKPGEYGVKLPFYFLFLKSYWSKNNDNNKQKREDLNDVKVEKIQLNEENSNFFEKEPTNLKATVKLKQLTKKFHVNFEERIKVNNLSLNFYENQVTGFLGINLNKKPCN